MYGPTPKISWISRSAGPRRRPGATRAWPSLPSSPIGTLLVASRRHGRRCWHIRWRCRSLAACGWTTSTTSCRRSASPRCRSSPATPPGCSSTGGRAPPEHRTVADLPELLRAGDLLVVNETKVIPARLRLRRATGGAAEVLLLEPRDDDRRTWEALVRPARKLRPGEVLLAADGRAGARRSAPRTAAGDTFPVELLGADDPLDAARRASARCRCRRTSRTRLDRPDRYQTVYAAEPGSAAAPTAGLHFTPELLDRISAPSASTVAPRRAGRRARHVPAGHRGRPARPPHAHRALPRARRDVGGVPRGRARRRRRHDERAGARERGGDRAGSTGAPSCSSTAASSCRSSTCC